MSVENSERGASKLLRGRAPIYHVDHEWLSLHDEEPIDPGLPIVDPHHHLWNQDGPYLVPQLVEDLRCGHNLRGSVYIEAIRWMHRADGDPRFATVGEVEWANGVAAEFASGFHGDIRACAGIVGGVDLTLGDLAEEVLFACIARAPDRFRGVRVGSAWDPNPGVTQMLRPPPSDLLMREEFRRGFAKLAPLNLTFDSWCYHPQLPQLIDLADSFPDTTIVVNHAGGRLGEGPYASRPEEVFADWKASIRALAKRPNVLVKLGGLNMQWAGFGFLDRDRPPTSLELAQAWRPVFETCIEAFGTSRAMFESNYPPDKAGCTPRILWNAFKRVAEGYSEDERRQLFAGTAISTYRLPEELGQ